MKLSLENTYAEKLEGLYAPWRPQGFPSPELVVLNEPLARELGLDGLSADESARLYSGTIVPEGAHPLAQAYAGHQFGGFSPRLGDGRAVLIGELRSADGQLVDLHLKGSGPTPFSRGGDGKATLGPVLREYLMGEAMHALGIPTTRVLAAVRTGEQVMRERWLPGAVLARVASSHLRVGTLECFAAPSDRDELRRLVDYALQRHYPDRVECGAPAQELLRSVALVQGQLIAQWMLVGFIHGVMNTDNTTLSGETIDYGPCAFMDTYDLATVFSSIDRGGRYAFGNQPAIGRWNLTRMGEALLPLLAPQEDDAVQIVRDALELYAESFERTLLLGMREKLGLSGSADEDESLISELLVWMKSTAQDYTKTFRRLAQGLLDDEVRFPDEAFGSWHTRWRARLGEASAEDVAARMNRVNPLYIPRNHLVEEALDAALQGDLGPFETFVAVLSDPFRAQAGCERYEEPAPPSFGPYQTFCGT